MADITQDKPVVVISPTAEIMSERLVACLEGTGTPPLRGLAPRLRFIIWTRRAPKLRGHAR